MKSIKVEFKNKEGDALSAMLEMPLIGKPRAYALFAHCFTCSKNLNAVRNISHSLSKKDIAVLRFDFTGLGESEGEFAESNFSTNIDDLMAAADFLDSHYEAPKILIGHSLGGAAVIHAADRLQGIEAIVTIGAPADPPHVMKLFREDLEEIKEKGVATVDIGGRPFNIKEQFIRDIESRSNKEILKQLKIPFLIFHSPQDKIVDITNASKLYNAAFHPKSFVSLDRADHLLSKEVDSKYVGEVISGWSSRYVHFEDREELVTEKQVVVRTMEDHYTTQVRAHNHSLIVDEPERLGGKDYGPNPYDYLLTALGACTSITLRMYADRKKWDVRSIKVHLEHNKIHAKDCETCDNKDLTGKIDYIERHLEFTGDLTDEQEARLVEIANRCPVHRTLHGDIHVDTRMVESLDVKNQN